MAIILGGGGEAAPCPPPPPPPSVPAPLCIGIIMTTGSNAEIMRMRGILTHLEITHIIFPVLLPLFLSYVERFWLGT